MAFLKPLVLLAALGVAGAAQAHVAADPGQAVAGAYQAVRFRVGHGCTPTAATTRLRIEMPANLPSVHAQPRPGWRLDFERDGQRIVAVSWSGRLAADEFEEFGLFFKLPDQAGALAFPAVQTCDAGEARWDGHDPAHPAPTLVLTPPPAVSEPSPHAGHEHH